MEVIKDLISSTYEGHGVSRTLTSPTYGGHQGLTYGGDGVSRTLTSPTYGGHQGLTYMEAIGYLTSSTYGGHRVFDFIYLWRP